MTDKELFDYMRTMDTNCAETLIRYANERYNLGLDQNASRMMAGFGGGMGKRRVCGALVGAVAAVGVLTVDDVGHLHPICKEASAELVTRFQQVYNSDLCEDIRPDYVDHPLSCAPVINATIQLLEEVVRDMDLLTARTASE